MKNIKDNGDVHATLPNSNLHSMFSEQIHFNNQKLKTLLAFGIVLISVKRRYFYGVLLRRTE